MTSPSPAGREDRKTFVARSPEDLVAAVPVSLGFFPEESVAMLTFGAARNLHARLDLPESADDVDAVVSALLTPALRNGVEQVAFVLYADDGAMVHEVAWSLADEFSASGIGVVDVLRYHDGHWFALLPGAPDAAYAGIAMDPATHRFAVQSVVEGRVTLPSRSALRDSVAARTSEVERTEAAVTDEPRPLGAREARAVVHRHVSDGTTCDAPELARLALALRQVATRDGCWELIDEHHAPQHVAFWSDVTRRVPDRLLAAPGSLLAFSAWLSGNGALSWCAVDRVREVAPGYRMAALVAQALEGALPPSAWRSGAA